MTLHHPEKGRPQKDHCHECAATQSHSDKLFHHRLLRIIRNGLLLGLRLPRPSIGRTSSTHVARARTLDVCALFLALDRRAIFLGLLVGFLGEGT